MHSPNPRERLGDWLLVNFGVDPPERATHAQADVIVDSLGGSSIPSIIGELDVEMPESADPYIVTVKRKISSMGGVPVMKAEPVRAVATLDDEEAARIANEVFDGRVDGMNFYEIRAAVASAHRGGTIGPLPDGTVIEVERKAFDIWHDDDGVWASSLEAATGTPKVLGPFPDEAAAERAVLDDFNEAQEGR